MDRAGDVVEDRRRARPSARSQTTTAPYVPTASSRPSPRKASAVTAGSGPTLSASCDRPPPPQSLDARRDLGLDRQDHVERRGRPAARRASAGRPAVAATTARPAGAPASIQRRISVALGLGRAASPTAASAGPRRGRRAAGTARSRPRLPGDDDLVLRRPRQRRLERVERQAGRDVGVVQLLRVVADRAAPGEERPDVALVGRRLVARRGRPAPRTTPAAGEPREPLRPSRIDASSTASPVRDRSMVEQEFLGVQQAPEQVLGPDGAARGLGDQGLGGGSTSSGVAGRLKVTR